jgi:hypothetical protein
MRSEEISSEADFEWIGRGGGAIRLGFSRRSSIAYVYESTCYESTCNTGSSVQLEWLVRRFECGLGWWGWQREQQCQHCFK